MKFLFASAFIICTSSVVAKSLSFECVANGMHPIVVSGNQSYEVKPSYNNGQLTFKGKISRGQKLLLGNDWSVAGNYGGYLKSATIYLEDGRIFRFDHTGLSDYPPCNHHYCDNSTGRASEIQEGEHLFYGQWSRTRNSKCNFSLQD
jgi:hypothetical protein